MKFILAIEPGSETTAFGVVVPDLPGCFSAGDSLDEAMDNAQEAIALYCETLIEEGGRFPETASLTVHQANPEFAGWIWAVIEVPVERYFGPAEKINITLPRLLLAKIDDYARQKGVSRSGFLADAARMAMR
ncbi:MAG: type II toxin-antitoxin system HicB family antitoxin [Candidatus Contendobacter sp.]|nr:type II toxin-antitoxin system HicB family antitoxin [Candidatus Contendobacter sp.]MDG4557256.1 type II toxin-antitoxin system HicB family antitoxin [Candidatus Contendobacter sp.]